MKLKIFTALAILVLTIFSCSQVDDLLTFNITNETSFDIKTGSLINAPIEVATPDVTTNSSADFENNNTNSNLVKDVKLQELILSITSPTDKNFSFLKSIHLYISTNADDEIELAYQDDINSASNTINLICTTEKLDKYIKSSSYQIRTKVITKETLTKDITVKSNMKFKVTADPF